MPLALGVAFLSEPKIEQRLRPVGRRSRQPLAKKKLRMPRRIIIQGGEDLVSALLIEWARFEAGRLQSRADATALDCVILGGLHQPGPVPLPAHSRGDPEMRDVQPAPPDIAEQSAQPFAPPALQEEAHRVPGREASRSNVER